jgi:hypothetical protein
MPPPRTGPLLTESPPLKSLSQSTPDNMGASKPSDLPLQNFSKSTPDYIHAISKYGPDPSSSSSTTSYPPVPPPIDINRRSRDECQSGWDSGDDKRFPGEFSSPRDAEKWDRYQETQSAENHSRATGCFDKPYGLASITADPRDARGAPAEEWYLLQISPTTSQFSTTFVYAFDHVPLYAGY